MAEGETTIVWDKTQQQVATAAVVTDDIRLTLELVPLLPRVHAIARPGRGLDTH